MADSIAFAVTNLAANAVVVADVDIANSRFNPPDRTRKISLYVVINLANGVRFTSGVAGTDHVSDVPGFFDTNLALSTRDNLLGSYYALPNQRFFVGYREMTGVATTDIQGLLILE
ncbi:MAG: hypothetical protein V3U03_15835 [Myxococcota bacterium]